MIRRHKPLLRRTPLKRMSDRRRTERVIYARRRLVFLRAHPQCQCCLEHCQIHEDRIPASRDIHHKHGRGRFYLDESTWMAVCRVHHDWIHSHPSQARAKGWLV
jgi:hypothetical protein